MKLHLAGGAFVSSIATLSLGNTAAAEQMIDQAYAYKDLTVSGLLMIAVIVLYRELRAEQKERKTIVEENRRFMELQSAAMKQAADSQGEALGEVVTVLQQLQDVTSRQVQLYDEVVGKLVDKQVGK